MMMTDYNLSPEQSLAQGFAEHVVLWATECGAAAETLPLVKIIAREVSIATSAGHACLLLEDLTQACTGIDTNNMRPPLLASGVVGTPETPDALPLILDNDGRIYLHRYFDYERCLAERLVVAATTAGVVDHGMKSRLDHLFSPTLPESRPDWQKLAAALALQRRLTIISGGPGTGKTTTVVNLLACLLAQNPNCRIALAAPTGKAATRMQEAIRQRATHLPPELQSLLPVESFTIHRLLEVTQREGQFRHHAGNPLAIDALVVDEASMLDLALAAKLFDAVPTDARIILLGDKDQLAAVEAGAVFSELSADPALSPACIANLATLTGIDASKITPPAPPQATPLSDSVIWFDENYRFAKSSGIGKLAAEINTGNADTAIDWLRAAGAPSAQWIEDGERTPAATTIRRIFDGYADYLDAMHTHIGNLTAVFDAFDRFRTLCAMREGTRGIDEINRLISHHFRQALNHPLDHGEPSAWYPGRPVMVLRNDYLLKLFNGDIGIVLPDEAGNLMAYFPDGDTGFRAIAPIRLPQHETAFAMTVHKSQGSEFDSVLLLLPAQPNRVVSRELLYTGITRARKQTIIVGNEAVFRQAIVSPTQRQSGLMCRIRDAAKNGVIAKQGYID